MQVALPSTYDFLDLADPAALFECADTGLDGVAIRRAIDTAVVRLEQDTTLLPAHRRMHVLVEAGRILLAGPKMQAEVIHLSLVAAPDLADTAPLANLRLRALWASSGPNATIAEVSRVLSNEALPLKGRRAIENLVRKLGLENAIPARIEDLREYWPDPEAAVIDPLREIVAKGPYLHVDLLGRTVAQLNGCDPQGEDTFLARARWGAELHRRMFYLKKIWLRIAAKSSQNSTPDEKSAMAIFHALNSRINLPDFTPLKEHIFSGQSVIVMTAHAGLSTIGNITKQFDDVPKSVVSNSAPPAYRPQDFNLAALGPGMAIEFAKLAKLMRKAPRFVWIFPDARNGELMEVTVCGRPVKIGRGAAALAYLGKAKIYFTRSVRTDEGFTFTLVPGPDAAVFEDRDAFEEAFGAFYAGCLEEIVLGAPEDMVFKGGFWPELKK